MTSRRLMGIGDSIMNSRNISTNNASSILDNSSKSIKTKTISTYATPKRNNVKHIELLYPLSEKKKLINKVKLLTDINGIDTINIKFSKPLYTNVNNHNNIQTESNKDPIELISKADQLLRNRRKNHLVMNHLMKSDFMKKSNQIRLDNYKIKLMTNKRNELNNRIYDINNAINNTEKIYEKDYQNFLQFVDNNNKTKKSQEYLLLKYKNMIDEKEIEYNKENNENKKLKNNIEYIVKKILILKNYGSFVNKVFHKDFIYETIHKSEGKDFLNIADDLIEVYEKNIGKYNKEDEDNKLLDEYLLMSQFNEYEQNLMNILNEKEIFMKDLTLIEYEGKSEIMKLLKRKKEFEKKLEMVQDDNIKFLKSIRTYNSPEIIDTALDCIDELTEVLGVENLSTSFLIKERNETNYTVLSSNLIKILKEKENIINNQIEEIEKVINGDNSEDKLLIEEIISDRKKEIKKEKFMELLKLQKEEIKKKMLKRLKR